MATVANTRALANTANRALRGLPPKYRGRDHANLAWQIKNFMHWDTIDMDKGDLAFTRSRPLVGGVRLITWVQSHLKGVPQPVLCAGFLQE